MDELVVPSELCRNMVRDPVAALDAAVELIGHMCDHIGVRDLGDVDVLDVGCGVRFTQAFLNRGVPIKHYVGVDVFPPVIDFLRSNVTDPGSSTSASTRTTTSTTRMAGHCRSSPFPRSRAEDSI